MCVIKTTRIDKYINNETNWHTRNGWILDQYLWNFDIENVQRRATKQIPSLKQLSYSDWLEKFKRPTLKYRRLRGDMIETFKIVNGIYDIEVTERFFKMSRTGQTRGHSKKIQKGNCRLNLRKHIFKNRVTDLVICRKS